MAIAVTGGIISNIGPVTDILPLASQNTKQHDAQGAIALPAFYESHMHLFGGGATLTRRDLSAIFGETALKQALQEHADTQPVAPLVFGFGANYTILGDSHRPDRHVLDRILPDRPVYIMATDLHTAWANTSALEQAGILDGRPLEGGACIVMGKDGLATGELREFAAMDLVAKLSDTGGRETLGLSGLEPGPVSDAEFERDLSVLKNGLEYCAAHGIAKIINMDGNFYQLDLLQELERRGELICRVELPYTLAPNSRPEDLEGIVARIEQAASDMLSVGRFKLFMDGVFDNWTALVTDEYPDRPGYAGHPLIEPDLFKALCIEADRLGWQISVHAVGDGAVRQVLDGYEAARKANGVRDSRHRIEHIDTIHDRDIKRLRELDIVASMQPVHPPGSAGLPLEPTVSMIGPSRWKNAFAWRRIADEGVPIAFATDWPVSPLDPLYAIRTAMTRQRWHEHLPDQRLRLSECLHAYTEGAAYAAFDEAQAGRLAPGMRGDLVLLAGGDLQDLECDTAHNLHCCLTMCAGKVTYQSG